MQKLFSATANPELFTKDVAIALGFFDGLHLGHQSLLNRLIEIGEQTGCATLVHTFQNHPLSVLAPEYAPLLLSTPYEKARLFARTAVDDAWILPFDREIADLSYEAFFHGLMRRLRIKHVVVGFNYAFGSGRKGTVSRLQELGKNLGFAVHVLAPFEMDGEPVSSTRIRQAVVSGRLKYAASLLSRPYSISGYVRRGQGLGHQWGVATANFRPPANKALPPFGVYASTVSCGDGMFRAITNIGKRPSVQSDGHIHVETHILDFKKELYDQHLDVYLMDFIRSERKFSSLEALYAQIGKDIQTRRDMME